MSYVFSSFVLAVILTSYVGDAQQSILKPVRHWVVLGRTDARDDTVSHYAFGSGLNPVHAAQTVRPFAISILQEGSTQALARRDITLLIEKAHYFLRTADSLRVDSRDVLLWRYGFPYPSHSLDEGWVSGMAQGYVLEILLAAWQATGDTTLFHAARKAGAALEISILEGGAAYTSPGCGVWFEEYAGRSAAPSFTLNGHIYAVESLHYLIQFAPEFDDLYQSGIYAVKKRLPRYDLGMWSKYDLAGRAATRHYQRVHIRQLTQLESWTGDTVFGDYADKFSRQLWFPFSALLRLVYSPSEFLALIMLMNWAIVWIIIRTIWPKLRLQMPRQMIRRGAR